MSFASYWFLLEVLVSLGGQRQIWGVALPDCRIYSGGHAQAVPQTGANHSTARCRAAAISTTVVGLQL